VERNPGNRHSFATHREFLTAPIFNPAPAITFRASRLGLVTFLSTSFKIDHISHWSRRYWDPVLLHKFFRHKASASGLYLTRCQRTSPIIWPMRSPTNLRSKLDGVPGRWVLNGSRGLPSAARRRTFEVRTTALIPASPGQAIERRFRRRPYSLRRRQVPDPYRNFFDACILSLGLLSFGGER
jgi:hypothetical protein